MGKHYQEAKESFKPIKNNPRYEQKKIAAESFKKSSLNVEIPQLINTEAIRFNPQSTTFFKPGEVKHELITRIPPKQIISNEKENKSLPNNEPTKQKKTRKNNKKETKTTDTSKPKRKPTEKQLAALARWIEIRAQKLKELKEKRENIKIKNKQKLKELEEELKELKKHKINLMEENKNTYQIEQIINYVEFKIENLKRFMSLNKML